jgi:hypothetical protein
LETEQAHCLHYFTLQANAARRTHNDDHIDRGNGNNIHSGNNRRRLRNNRGAGREHGRDDDGQRTNGREFDNKIVIVIVIATILPIATLAPEQ